MRKSLIAGLIMLATPEVSRTQVSDPAATDITLAEKAQTVRAESPALWRGLSHGHTVAEVSQRLLAYPEIKAVKPKQKKGKPPTLKVSMNDGALPVYGSAFSLRTTFDLGGRLTELTLVSESECADEAVEKYHLISGALAEKYGETLTDTPPLDGLAVSSALMASYRSEQQETLTYGYANDDVAVAFVVAFHKTKRPPYPGGGALAQSLHAIAEGLYEAQKSKCRNSGDETVTYAIKYLARSDFDARVGELEAIREEADWQADENL